MLIKDMFKKDIDRVINGVVKVGQTEETVIKQELEEYVVTNELQKHFNKFYTNYTKSINNRTDQVGVWISGFFGSGKSHFLKILSYLLDDEEVGGKKAIDYFIEENKIDDAITIANMKKCASIPSDIILFNIDAKSETTGTKDLDVLVGVFLKVFNEKQGYSTDPHIADLERKLEKENKYSDFQEKFKEISGKEWKEIRHESKFMRTNIINSLVQIGFQNEADAKHWHDTTKHPYVYGIESFVAIIEEYIKNQPPEYHLVFLIDEMGQYIGSNESLMLNLQSITEEIGTRCNGQVWLIVTSQQEIDSITDVMGDDFSKIQGRFDTRLSLTSANVDEVIKLRILEKNETGAQTLSVLYDQNETVLKNLLTFENGPEMKIFKTKQDFVEIYPFVPYQFTLLGKVLPAIRKQGASGKHLSEGERSLLALFKESAEKLKNQDDGHLAPFYIFYDALSQWLDHSHSGVIAKAYNNDKINYEKDENNQTINVLKTLFLIKYVDEIQANLENIVTLMVSKMDDKRVKLEEEVVEALKILENQMLIRKSGNVYTFLTDEEQEIETAIKHQGVESSALIKKVSEIIFEDIYKNNKITRGKNNEITFTFDRKVDENSYGVKANEFGLNILTPRSSLSGKEATIKLQSADGKTVYLELPNDGEFLEEITESLKIESFLNSSDSRKFQNIDIIRITKSQEAQEHFKRGKLLLEESFREGKIYLSGSVFNDGKNVNSSIGEALEQCFNTVYDKFGYFEENKTALDIENLFKNKNKGQLELGTDNFNQNAIKEINNFIMIRTPNNSAVSLKEIKDRFVKSAPYGWQELGVEWALGKIFVNGEIGFKYNGMELNIANTNPKEFTNYLTGKAYVDKIQILRKETIPNNLIKSAKEIAAEVFGKNIITEETDFIYTEFHQLIENKLAALQEVRSYYKNKIFYPGEKIVEEGIKLLNSLRGNNSVKDSFEEVHQKKNALLDFAEDYDDVNNFFSTDQKKIWETSYDYKNKYDDGKTYIQDQDIEKIYQDMINIIENDSPYMRIRELPELNTKFMNLYTKLMERDFQEIKEILEQQENITKEHLENREDLKDGKFENIQRRIIEEFRNLYKKAEVEENIKILKSYTVEATALRKNLMAFIDNIPLPKPIDPIEPPDDDSVVPTIKTLNIKTITTDQVWKIETKTDIQKYLREIERKLESELDGNTIIEVKL